MTTIAIELSDAGLTVATAAGDVIHESPGYALEDGGRLLVGFDAWRRARILPRRIQNRFWDQLGQQPLAEPIGEAHTAADLAFAHLADVWSRVGRDSDGTILAVPSQLEKTQLGLLLGIAQSAALPVAGMVNAAVAAARAVPAGARAVHVDVHLHRAVLTELRLDSGVALGNVESSAQIGLLSLYDTWIKLISDLFVRSTRFDPLHVAETEQRLYIELPEILATLAREPSAVLRLEFGGQAHAVSLLREQVAAVASDAYRKLAGQLETFRADGEPLVVQLSARAARLPGLAATLATGRDCEVVALEPGDAVLGALEREGEIRSPAGSTRLVVSLASPQAGVAGQPAESGDRRAAAESPVATGEPANAPPPTHVLYRNVAHPVESSPLAIGTSAPRDERGIQLTTRRPGLAPRHCTVSRSGEDLVLEDLSEAGTFVNGRRVEGRTLLRVGDRIRLGPGEDLRVISVQKD